MGIGLRKKVDEMRIRRCSLLGLWILSLITISFYGGAISYGFFFAVTLLPLISFVYLVMVYFFFRVYQSVERRDMICGQPTPYFFILQNDGYCPFAGVSVKLFSSFSYVEKIPDDTEYELLHGDKYVFETNLVCKYRGEYEVGIKEIIVTDMFRLFRLQYQIPSTIRALVKPKITKLDHLESLGEISGLMQKKSMQADTEPDVIMRDYVTGDALKQISWKATAREQKLKVRNRIGEEKQGIILLGDMKRYSREIREYLPMENKMLEIMAALGIFLAEKNMSFTAYYGQSGIVSKRVESIREYEEYYESIAKVVYSEDEDFTCLMAELTKRGAFWNGKLLFGILHELNEEIMRMTEQLARAGMIVILYVVTEEKYEDYVRQSNERRKIITIPVEAELRGRL